MVAEARARLSLDSKPFTDGLRGVQDEVEKKFSDSLKGVGKQIAQVFTVGAITNFAKEIISTADEVINLSNRLGIGTETIQSLRIEAKEAGIDFGTMESAILKTQKAAVDATTGNKNLAKAFSDIGISIDDLRSLDPEDLFERVTKALADNSENADTVNAVFDIIGSKSGPALKNLLIQLGEDGFDALNEKMRDSNQIMSDETLKNWDDFGDQIAKSTRQIQSWVGTAGGALIGFIEDFAGMLGAASAGADITWDQYKRQQADIETANKANEEAAEARRKANQDAADAAREEGRKLDEIADLQKKIADKEFDKLGASEKITKLKQNEKDILDKIKELDDSTLDGQREKLRLQLELSGVQDNIVKAEKDLAKETDNANKPKRESANLAKQQLESFDTLKKIIRGMSEKELKEFLTMMQSIAYAVAGLADVPKDKLEWVNDLAQLKFVGLTTSQAAQMERALTELIDGISKLPSIPEDKLRGLEAIMGIKFTGLTTGQASQMARAIEALVNGVKGLDVGNFEKIGKGLEFIDKLKDLGPGGKWELEITLPHGMENGIPLVVPDGMDGDLASIAADLKVLSGLKGVVWA